MLQLKPYLPSTYVIKHSISVAVSVAIALIINFFYGHGIWLVLAAFLMGQTTRGTPLRQSLFYALIILAVILLAASLSMLPTWLGLSFSLAIFLFAHLILIKYKPYSLKTFFFIMLFPLLLLVAILNPPLAGGILYEEIIDAFCGIVIGLICAKVIFPVNSSAEFALAMQPLFADLMSYGQKLKANILTSTSFVSLKNERLTIEKYFTQASATSFPEWAYEIGFNPGLREGFRFFLLKIENVIESLFSLAFYLQKIPENALPVPVAQAMAKSLQENVELMLALKNYFSHQAMLVPKSDLTSDIKTLEENLKEHLPKSIELIDVSIQYTSALAVVRNLKDMRELLLQLVMALPERDKPHQK